MDYSYVAYDAELKLTKGMISAASDTVANQVLAKRGYRVLRLKPLQPLLPTLSRLFPSLSRPNTSEIVTFSRQLALLIQSGISITRALDLLAAQTTDKRLQNVLRQISSDIRGGTTLSAALAKHPSAFPAMYSRLISVGEHTGGSDGILRQLADYLERQEATASKVKTAMIYPILVLGMAIAVVTVLMMVALPPLVGMFKTFRTGLPVTTRLLIAIVEFGSGYWMFIFPGLLALLVGAVLYVRTKAGRYRLDKLLITVPLIGRVSLLSELGRCCRSMALMFHAGVPVHEVMALASRSSSNTVVRHALDDVGRAVIRGEGLSRPMARNPVFLPLMVEMTKVGEETGNPDETLMTVAQTYEVEADERTRRLIGLIEPAMTIAMGVLVGFIALSIFMPIYGMLGALH